MVPINSTEDARAILERVRARSKKISGTLDPLERHWADLVKLQEVGASYPELAAFLRQERRLTVKPEAIRRSLRRRAKRGVTAPTAAEISELVALVRAAPEA